MVTRGRKSNRKSNDPKHSSSWVKVFGEKRNFMLLRRSSFSHKNVGRDRCWDGFHPHKFVRYLEQSTAHVHGSSRSVNGLKDKTPKKEKKKWKITDSGKNQVNELFSPWKVIILNVYFPHFPAQKMSRRMKEFPCYNLVIIALIKLENQFSMFISLHANESPERLI